MFLSIYLSIIINWKYRMIAFHLCVLCIGILLSWHTNDIFFWGGGWQANFGTRISLSESMSLKQINKTAVYLIMSVKLVFILLQSQIKIKANLFPRYDYFPYTIYTITCITCLRSTIQIKYVMFPMITSASLMKPNIHHLYLNPLCSLYLTSHVLT